MEQSHWPVMACDAHLQKSYEYFTMPSCECHKKFAKNMTFVQFPKSFELVEKLLRCLAMANSVRIFVQYCGSILRYSYDVVQYSHDTVQCFETCFLYNYCMVPHNPCMILTVFCISFSSIFRVFGRSGPIMGANVAQCCRTLVQALHNIERASNDVSQNFKDNGVKFVWC